MKDFHFLNAKQVALRLRQSEAGRGRADQSRVLNLSQGANEGEHIMNGWLHLVGVDDAVQKAGHTSVEEARDRAMQQAGSYSTQTARDLAFQQAGNNSQQKAGHWALQEAGCNSQQTAGNRARQAAGHGSMQDAYDTSVQTAGDNSVQNALHDAVQTAGRESIQKSGERSIQDVGPRSYQKAGINSVQITRWLDEDGWKVAARVITASEANRWYAVSDGIWRQSTLDESEAIDKRLFEMDQ